MKKFIVMLFVLASQVISTYAQMPMLKGPDSLSVKTLQIDSVALQEKSMTPQAVSDESRFRRDSIITFWPDEYLDTVKIEYASKMNDYSMIGFNYGVTLTGMQFSPSHSQQRDLALGHYSLTFTHYEKMFNYLPYFGWTIGIEYGHEGYHFKKNKETGNTWEYYVEKSTAMQMDVIEVPFMLQVHRDALHSKAYAGLGIYGGYRLSVERSGPNVEEAYKTAFYDTDIRWDYGFQGGIGAALIFEPFEFHINAQLRYGLSSIFTANSLFPSGSDLEALNSVYYRYAYPLDIIISAGVHIQLGKRYGTTNADLKRQAKEIVYGKDR